MAPRWLTWLAIMTWARAARYRLPLTQPAAVYSLTIQQILDRRRKPLAATRSPDTMSIQNIRNFLQRCCASLLGGMAGVSSFEWLFLALRLCIQKFRSPRPWTAPVSARNSFTCSLQGRMQVTPRVRTLALRADLANPD